jgi:TonB family protein
MSRRFHPNPFDLLGQTEMYVYPVRLAGAVEPKLEIAWKNFHGNFFSGIPVFFQRAKLDKHAPPSEIFPDVTVERRLPLIGFLAAALLHAAIFLAPWPDIPITPQRNHAFDDTQLTWSGPIDDLPLLNIPKSKTKSAPKADPAQSTPAESAAAFHPRQRINTDPVHPTHPRQTLINPTAPPEAPKILPDMPNVVQLASARAPARPHMQISETALAKLHPKVSRIPTTADAPTPEIANAELRTAVLNITSSPEGPARPKLQINASSVPRAAERSQPGENVAAPEVPLANTSGSSNGSTLIALSAAPAPPSPVIPVPQGNLAARVAISPEGKSGVFGNSPEPVSGGAGDSGNSASGAGNNSIGISISGGNPKPNANVSGLGAPGKLTIPKSQSALMRPSPDVSIEEPAERTGPPNFSALPPDAKPEQIFASKHVYSLNINMPNVSSFTGSWIIHFSELHLADAAHRSENVTSPVPVRKVDPKYPQDLALQHVEGEVILYGVIRRDGSVDSIQKVRGIDPQLDANSIAAFAQWKFQPATRKGEPVDLEAVVHIPFKARDRRYPN